MKARAKPFRLHESMGLTLLAVDESVGQTLLAVDESLLVLLRRHLALCKDDSNNAVCSFAFGIRGNDTLTLYDSENTTLDSVSLLGPYRQYDVTFAPLSDGTRDFEYTASPTFGAANQQADVAAVTEGMGDGSPFAGDPETSCDRLKAWKGRRVWVHSEWTLLRERPHSASGGTFWS